VGGGRGAAPPQCIGAMAFKICAIFEIVKKVVDKSKNIFDPFFENKNAGILLVIYKNVNSILTESDELE
jgi:hypothetical protein